MSGCQTFMQCSKLLSKPCDYAQHYNYENQSGKSSILAPVPVPSFDYTALKFVMYCHDSHPLFYFNNQYIWKFIYGSNLSLDCFCFKGEPEETNYTAAGAAVNTM